jgi:HAD superfamily hydrolase (TIGR01509 family)
LTPPEVQAVVEAVPAELAPIPGTVAILAALREAGHRLFFLSNMPQPYALHLEQYDFVRAFEDGVFSARVGCRKPAASIFQIAFERFGIQPGEAIFIDDHPANIAAAQALGLPAVLFTTPQQLALDLAARGVAVPALPAL